MRWTLLLGLLCPLGIGCVQRTLTIHSEPPGALVFLNDEEVGRTPLTVPFTWYGVYDVRMEKDGYLPLWTTAEAKAPLWDVPGPDLVAEAIPNTRSEIHWNFELEKRVPISEYDTDALIQRAKDLRAQTRGKSTK